MRGLLQENAAAAADAYMAWWSLAGVDCAVGEQPVNWLRPAPTVARAATTDGLAHAAATAPAIPVYTPDTLDAFHDWIANDADQPERRWPGTPILPSGPARAPLMIVTDMPDMADMAAATLLADKAGVLFSAMLRAIGLTRESIYLASLFTSRPPGGMVEASDLSRAADRMRLLVSLATPARILLLGDRTIRALLPTDAATPAIGLRPFNHQGGTVPAAATFHPRLLLTQPTAKAECWRTLQSLIEEDRP